MFNSKLYVFVKRSVGIMNSILAPLDYMNLLLCHFVDNIDNYVVY